MRLFYIIFLSTFLVLAIGVGAFGYWLVNSGNNNHKTTIESELGKISKLLSGQSSSVMKDGTSDTDRIGKTRGNLQNEIPAINKGKGEFSPFVTDKKGNVIYNSANNEDHVVGVVSVSKSLDQSENVIRITKKNIIILFGFLFLFSGIIGIFLLYLLTQPLRGLINYALAVKGGENARPPTVSVLYFKEMCAVFEEMRITLQKTEHIKNYVSEVVHALKTPLTTIKASAAILKDEIPEDKGRLFSHIESETDRASKSLDDLLELAQVEGQRELKEKRTFSIKELIEENLRSFEPVITRKKIQVKYESGSYKSVITGDEKMIQRTLEELINNAIDFSPVEGKVVIETKGDKKKVEIFIRDQGPGIPDYAKEQIFKKFYSLKRPNGRKSSGLGLAYAKEIILLHNGEISLEPSSAEMCGANFRISFVRS